jgi:hypothetical protein
MSPATGSVLIRQSLTVGLPLLSQTVPSGYVVVHAVDGAAREGPNLSAFDLLNVHHRLRC